MSQQAKANLLITGASSYTGAYLIQKLLKETNLGLLLASRHPLPPTYHDHPRIRTVKFDLNAPSNLQEIFKNHPINGIIHLAAMARLSECEQNPMEAIRVNLMGSLELIRMAQEYQVKSFLFTSSDLARNATSVVGMCKYLTEDIFRYMNQPKIRCCTLRLVNVVDSPGAVTLLFKKQIQNGGPVTITHPDMSRRFVSGERAANMIWEAYNHGHHNDLYVSTEEAINITQLAHDTMKQLNQEVPIEYIGPKPGERLAEPGYSTEETRASDLSGLGILKTNPVNPQETRRMIQSLLDLAIRKTDQGLKSFLETLKNLFF